MAYTTRTMTLSDAKDIGDNPSKYDRPTLLCAASRLHRTSRKESARNYSESAQSRLNRRLDAIYAEISNQGGM
jgi:hypothetical protein